ncbi:MAG: UxaA family hydrolase [Sedimentibacter sp.]
MQRVIGLKVNEKDNVAVVFTENVKKDTEIEIRDHKGNVEVITLKSEIPFGHKIAIVPIKNGTPIIKYGEEIGVATSNIEIGEHVHVNNLDSQRSRGDKTINGGEKK